MPQFEGLAIPFSGDSDAKTSGNAAWLQTLRRAALGRNNQTLPQDPAETGIILKGYGVAIPAWSLIGAVGATYPGSPTSEPSPYLQATLGSSDLLLYVKDSYPASVEYIEAFAFQPGKPIRVRVDPTDPDYPTNYVPGSKVGRLLTTNYLSKDATGLILVSVPYTADGGTSYYAWVVAYPTSSSTAPRVRFVIESTVFTIGMGAIGCDFVNARVTHVSCGGAGVAVGDEIQVYDPEYCHFNLPIELLVGLCGTATLNDATAYIDGLDGFEDCLTQLLGTECMWMIDTLCCSEEETIGG